MQLTHPNRNSPQYAYSDRDIAYLEMNGWVRLKPPEQRVEQVPVLLQPKRGRPVKQ